MYKYAYTLVLHVEDVKDAAHIVLDVDLDLDYFCWDFFFTLSDK